MFVIRTASTACTTPRGPSGAGKSTLLNTLAGRLRGDGVSGKIMADGKTINPAAFRSHIAYGESLHATSPDFRVATTDAVHKPLPVSLLTVCVLRRMPARYCTKRPNAHAMTLNGQ